MPGKLRKRTTRGSGLAAEAREESSLPLLEAACLGAGLPRALGLAQELEAADYFCLSVVGQWRLTQERIAERALAASDARLQLRELAATPEARLRFHVPGVIARCLAQWPELALQELRPLASDEHQMVAEAVQAFGVRPQAEQLGPAIVETLLEWARDPSEWVRRAAMESVRPRGVWVKHLQWTVEAPALLLPLVEELRGDRSQLVANAVGNALNDVSKKSPELVLEIVARWQEEGEAGPYQEHIARKALRSLAKAGDARALALLGFERLEVQLSARLTSAQPARPNSALMFELEIQNDEKAARADLVYEICTPGKHAQRPRKQRFRAGAIEIPGYCVSQFAIRERIFDRKAAKLIDGECSASFFLNGEEYARLQFELQRKK